MVIYLPCKLGEQFREQKFKEWIEGERVYEEGQERTLKGFNAAEYQTRSLSIPTMHTDSGFLSYDYLGEFSQEYIPKYKILVDVKSEYKLSDRGFPGGRSVRLNGLKKEGKHLLADFVTSDRAEHLKYAIKDTLQYAGVDETPIEFYPEYDQEADKERSEQGKETSENSKEVVEIQTNEEKPQNKEISITAFIKAKMKRTETEDEQKSEGLSE